MHNRFQSLPFHALAPAARHVRPRQQFPDTVTADTPAVFVMTDLRQVPAVTVNAHLNITQTLERMQRKGVRMLFVTDQDDAVRGIITTTDILGERPLRIIQAGGGRRDDVLVSQVMTPHEQLDALDLNDVLRARVGDIVATLKAAARLHLLVVEGSAGQRTSVRGIFSATQIGRLMSESIETLGRARNFAEIEHALHA